MAVNADDADTAAAPDPGVRAVGRAADEAAGPTWPPLCGLLLGLAVALAVALIRLVDSADTELRVPASAGQLYCDVAGGSAHPAGHPGGVVATSPTEQRRAWTAPVCDGAVNGAE